MFFFLFLFVVSPLSDGRVFCYKLVFSVFCCITPGCFQQGPPCPGVVILAIVVIVVKQHVAAIILVVEVVSGGCCCRLR